MLPIWGPSSVGEWHVGVRVFVLDDHEVVRRGVRVLLDHEDDVEVVGDASTVGEALAQIQVLAPDVAVLDVRLPDGDGVELCRQIQTCAPGTRCLLLTGSSDRQAAARAVEIGAAGFLRKDAPGDGLVAAIRRLAEGERLCAVVDGAGAEPASGVPEEARRLDHLTRQERRVLELVARG